MAEARPEDDEVKSEAAFQRLLASCSDLPLQPRTPRAPSDRGRYPEEVGDEEVHREGSPSDDDDDDVDAILLLDPQGEHMAAKPCTPSHSVNGDDPPMSLMGSPMVMAMDVDAVWPHVPCASTGLIIFFLALGIAVDNLNTSLGAVAIHTSSNHQRSPLK